MVRRPLTILLPVALLAVTASVVAGPPIDPSDQEMLGIYDLNRARSDPEAYGDSIGLDLDDVDPQPPLALSRHLTASARFHVEEMRDHDYFAHTSEVTGDGPNQMAVDHGYDLFGSGVNEDWGTDNYIESLAYGYNMFADYPEALAGLIIDDGVPGAGHRVHLLAMSSFFEKHREIGAGRATIGSKRYYAFHTGYVSSTDTFLTGVVYEDVNLNRRYDAGEGMGGVTVRVSGNSAVTGPAGGYSIPTVRGSGPATVTCSGGSFPGTATAVIDVEGDNIEVDFRRGRLSGDVNFVASGGTAVLATDIDATDLRGDAPHAVAFEAWCEDPTASADWCLGDGETEDDESFVHEYDSPGVFPVILRTQSGDGDGVAVTIVAVDDPAGAGVGTTAPASTALTPSKLKIKVKHTTTGKDKIDLKATLTMPAGFVAGSHPVEVCVGPVKVAFTIAENGKATLPDGSKIKLKWSGRDGDDPIGAGVTAKLKIKLRGDFAERLTAANMRDADEIRSVEEFPFAFHLDGLCYEGSVTLAVTNRAGSKSKGKMTD